MMILYTVTIVFLSVMRSSTDIKHQLLIILVSPLNFLLSYILTITEYVSLINSLIHSRTIFDYKKNHANWNHVERMK